MSDSINFQFPSLNIPEKEKNEEWHKKFVQGIVSQNINSKYTFSYSAMNECVNFYQGLQSGEEFNFIQEAEDGEALPAKWANYNKIKVKIDLLLGELSQKGYDISVRAINKDAKVRKLEEKKRLLVEMKLNPVAEQLEETYGLPMKSSEFIPENEEELDEYFDNNYKEVSEILMESALKFIAKRNKWDYERLSLFRDLLIFGRVVSKTELDHNGIPKTRRIDPRLFIFDSNATDDYLSDSTYYGEVRYMNIGDAAQKYNLSRKEIDEAYKSYREFMDTSKGGSYISDFSVMDQDTLKFFDNSEGELRVLVVEANWVDTKQYNHKVSTDKYGNEHIKRVSDTSKASGVEKRTLKIWRKGTLIGGKFLKDWGELENQPRNLESLSDTEPLYKVLIPNYLNGQGVSKVQQLKSLQSLKDIAMYNVQLSMARAGTKGFVYDTAQVPDDWDVHTVIKYLKSVGIAFINSKKDGLPATFNQFQQIDLSLSQSITYLLEVSAMVDREMDAVSGINEARQGIVQNASQAVGVTQSALMQSSLSTASYFKLFEDLCSSILNIQAQLVKIAWAGKEKFAPIIGDTGINFLEQDIDLDLDDYSVFAQSIPPALDDVQKFQELVIAALQAGQLDFVDAMKLLRERDITQGIRRFEKEVNKKQKEQMEQEQAMAMQQQEAQAAMQQGQAQAAMQQQQMGTQSDMQIQELKTAGDIRKILAKGRIDLSAKKIDVEKEMMAIEQKIAASKPDKK